MADEELIRDFEAKFVAMQKKLGFASSLEELDRIFYLRDFISKEGFVSNRLSRMLCSRIIGTFAVWENYFHALVVPNPNSMPNVEESKLATEEDKKDMLKIMNRIRELNTRNTIIGLEEDEKAEGKLFDDAVLLWNSNKPFFIKIMRKMNTGWMKGIKEGLEKAASPKKESESSQSFFG
jgi:hypothetical protein